MNLKSYQTSQTLHNSFFFSIRAEVSLNVDLYFSGV